MWTPTYDMYSNDIRNGSINVEWILSITAIEVQTVNRGEMRWIIVAETDVESELSYRISSGSYSSRELALEALDSMIEDWEADKCT